MILRNVLSGLALGFGIGIGLVLATVLSEEALRDEQLSVYYASEPPGPLAEMDDTTAVCGECGLEQPVFADNCINCGSTL